MVEGFGNNQTENGVPKELQSLVVPGTGTTVGDGPLEQIIIDVQIAQFFFQAF